MGVQDWQPPLLSGFQKLVKHWHIKNVRYVCLFDTTPLQLLVGMYSAGTA